MDGASPAVRLYIFGAMAELRFFFGTMGSGKSTQALQVHHNLTERGLRCVLITQLDRTDGKVSSRLGVSADAVVINPTVDLYRLIAAEHSPNEYSAGSPLDAVLCDEAQFYEPHQIDQLARVVDDLGIDVFAYGLLTSFQGELFPGTKRLLELADSRSELQVEARCFCGRRATHNARLVNGQQVYDGALMVVGDTGQGDDVLVSYDLRCRQHWLAGKEDVGQDSLFDILDLTEGAHLRR